MVVSISEIQQITSESSNRQLWSDEELKIKKEKGVENYRVAMGNLADMFFEEHLNEQIKDSANLTNVDYILHPYEISRWLKEKGIHTENEGYSGNICRYEHGGQHYEPSWWVTQKFEKLWLDLGFDKIHDWKIQYDWTPNYLPNIVSEMAQAVYVRAMDAGYRGSNTVRVSLKPNCKHKKWVNGRVVIGW